MALNIKKENINTNQYKPKKNLAFVAGASLGIVLIAGALFWVLSQVLATDVYYVLRQDIPAKTQVTSDMITPITTAKGTAPQNAISNKQVAQGTVYSRIPLSAGDVLSSSNTGLNIDTTLGIPDTWGVTSFNINADNAAGGNISRGQYFDIIGVNSEGAQYLFYNVLTLDVKGGQQSSTVNAQGQVVQLGETVQYVVGMPSDKIPLLHAAIKKFDSIQLVLSPKSLSYEKRNTEYLNGQATVSSSTKGSDLFTGTDSSFSNVLRDDNGRPVNPNTCADGIVSPKTLCDNIKFSSSDKSTEKEHGDSHEDGKKDNKSQGEKTPSQNTGKNQ